MIFQIIIGFMVRKQSSIVTCCFTCQILTINCETGAKCIAMYNKMATILL